MQAQRPAGIAARAGLITGFFVGVLSLPVITINGVTGGRGLFLLFLLIAFIAFAIAGYLAARRSGRIRSGLGAGALAAGIAMFIAICCGIVIVTLLASRAPLAPGRVRVVPLARQAILRLVIGSLVIFGVGTVGGFVGGLLGRLSRPRAAFGSGAAGAAPPFTPPPAPAFIPLGGYTPGDSSTTTPQPYYPLAPAYDGDAPTVVNPSSPQP